MFGVWWWGGWWIVCGSGSCFGLRRGRGGGIGRNRVRRWIREVVCLMFLVVLGGWGGRGLGV